MTGPRQQRPVFPPCVVKAFAALGEANRSILKKKLIKEFRAWVKKYGPPTI